MVRYIVLSVFALLFFTACGDGVTEKDVTPPNDATVEARPTEELPKDTTIKAEPTPDIIDPYSAIQESTVKISYLTAYGEVWGSGVIVGDGNFVVTNAHVVNDASGDVDVTHYQEVGPRTVTNGSIIYIDDFFDLALIRLADPLGSPVNASFGTPKLGEALVIGGFPAIGGETFTATSGTVAGFELDGAIIKFDGEIGEGNSGGPALNTKGQLVGIVTYSSADEGGGNLGMMFSNDTFSYGLVNELLRYNETSSPSGTQYGLKVIGIPAYVSKPADWTLHAHLNYAHIAAPNTSMNSDNSLAEDYKVVGILMANSLPGESSGSILNRLITEFGDSFQVIDEPSIPTPSGFEECQLTKTVQEYSETAFTRRGYVHAAGWFSHRGLYTAFCVGTSEEKNLIIFAESPDLDDIVHENGLLSKIGTAGELTPNLTPIRTVHQTPQIQEKERKSMFDVRDGDCLEMYLPDVGDIENTNVVDCNGNWDAKVLNSFVVDVNGVYPGKAFFEQQSMGKCDRRTSYLLMPTEESWLIKDRTVNCVQDSYGLETTQLDKLDRMVDSMTLMKGECFNDVPISQGLMVELVPCHGNWEYKVANTFRLVDGPFPGDSYIDRQADDNCQRGVDFFIAPSEESWSVGGRVVKCLQER